MTAARLLPGAVIVISAAILTAWLASILLRRRRSSPALRSALWKTALALFWLVPMTAMAAQALNLQFPLFGARLPQIAYHARPLSDSSRGLYRTASLPSRFPAAAADQAASAASRLPGRPSPLAVVLAIWGAGLLLGALYFLRHLRALAHLRRACKPIDDPELLRRLAAWASRMGLRRAPAVAESPLLSVPTMLGWRRPVLLVPSGFSADDPSCDAVLVHELAHVSRGDLATHAIARITRILWWWHPLAYVVRSELHLSAEEACDDWAVSLTGQKHSYADHLVRWAEAAGTRAALAYACGGKDVIRRVYRILSQEGLPQVAPSRRARAILLACAAATALAAGGLCAPPVPAKEAPTKTEGREMNPSDNKSGAEVLPRSLAQIARERFSESLGDGIVYQAGLPTAYVQALNHAGTEIDFAEFAALSGWAFSFGYRYDDISTAFLAVRGQPGGSGPYEAFQIADWFGYDYESVPTENKDDLWDFVRAHIDADAPLLSEHLDGGLICGYREHSGNREVWFAVNPPTGEPTWVDINDLHPYEVCVLTSRGKPLPRRDLYLKGLHRAVRYATLHETGGVPQGVAALDAYAADVADASKDFADVGAYFCWATFERLNARKCAAVWLERAAEVLDRKELRNAAEHYQRAYELYDRFRVLAGAGQPSSESLQERARTPEKIAQLVPPLRGAIDEEKAGLAIVQEALRSLGADPPVPEQDGAAEGQETAS